MVSLAIGLGVLYRRRTGPIATTPARHLRRDRLDHRRHQNGLVRSLDVSEERAHRRRRRARRRAPWSPPISGSRGTRASTVTTDVDQDARPRSHRVGVGQDSAEAARQHQRRNAGPRRRSRGQRRRPRSRRASSCCRSTRSRCAPASTAAPRRCRRPKASLEQLRQSVETARVAARAGAAEPRPASGTCGRSSSRRARRSRRRRTTCSVGASRRCRSARSRSSSQDSRIAQERATLESARYDLSKVRIESPIDGIVTRRNIQEGETAVIGTMNNAGTVLLTLADMSVIQAEVEVDETNIPHVQLGQLGEDHDRRDARPDVQGPRHRDRQQPDSGRGRAAPRTQATNFKVVVMLDEPVPDVRPGFTCTADITTATRKDVVAVPIPAVAVRELVYDANGQIVKEPRTDKRRRSPVETVAAAAGAQAGADAQGNRRRLHRARRHASSSCRSRWASPATSTSRC